MDIKWHYIKDELPEPNSGSVLLLALQAVPGKKIIQYATGFYVGNGEQDGHFVFQDGSTVWRKVIAWTEINFPKDGDFDEKRHKE